MRTLITGATGFVGTNLVRELARRGETLRILRRESSNTKGLENLAFEECIGDIRDPYTVREAVRGCTHIYHVAGISDVVPFAWERFRSVNVVGTANIVRAAIAEGIERFVFTSSSVTIGYGTRKQVATEERAQSLDHIQLPYFRSKRAAEQLVLRHHAQDELPAVVVNPGYIFGAWDKNPKLNQMLILAAKGKLRVAPRGGLSVVDVQDVVRGHILAMERGVSGQRYILSNENISYRAFADLLNTTCLRRTRVRSIPNTLMFSLGAGAELFAKHIGRNPPISRDLARLLALDHFISSDRARRELGYTPTALQLSLEQTLRWLSEHQFIGELPIKMPNELPEQSEPRWSAVSE